MSPFLCGIVCIGQRTSGFFLCLWRWRLQKPVIHWVHSASSFLDRARSGLVASEGIWGSHTLVLLYMFGHCCQRVFHSWYVFERYIAFLVLILSLVVCWAGRFVPALASSSALSLPWLPVWALIQWILRSLCAPYLLICSSVCRHCWRQCPGFGVLEWPISCLCGW